MLKASVFDLTHLPLMTELFHSRTVDVRMERKWFLDLMKTGFKDTIDYAICQKSYAIKTLMAFYDCSVCEQMTKVSETFHEIFINQAERLSN